MTIGEMKIGDFLRFNVGREVLRRVEGRAHDQTTTWQMDLAWEGSWYNTWRNEKEAIPVSPCKCCLDLFEHEKTVNCPCWFKKENNDPFPVL